MAKNEIELCIASIFIGRDKENQSNSKHFEQEETQTYKMVV